MSRVKNKETKLEKEFRKLIWKAGVRYRKNPKGYFGKPDLAIKKRRTVIFVDSCFWHGCEVHCRLPQTNKVYWVAKIIKNKERDEAVNKIYKEKGWKVLRFWEHELKKKQDEVIGIIENLYQSIN